MPSPIFLFALSEDFTVSILANDINRDCTGQYHFRNKISKSDQKEKDEADSRGNRLEAGAKIPPSDHPASTWCSSLPAQRNISNVAYLLIFYDID